MNAQKGFLRAKGIFILFFGFFIWAIIPFLPCWGVSIESKPPALTLDIKDLPLKDTLNRMSHDTGYEITVSQQWAEVLLTVNFNDLALEAGLKEILRVLGSPSHFIVTDERNRNVEILIIGSPIGHQNTVKSVAIPMDMDVTSPSESREQGLVLADLEAIQEEQKKKQEALPKNTVISPPSMSGGPGLTLGDLEAIQEEQKKKQEALPKNTVISPPSMSGGPGLTLGELEAIQKEQKKKQEAPQQIIMITPPSGSGQTNKANVR